MQLSVFTGGDAWLIRQRSEELLAAAQEAAQSELESIDCIDGGSALIDAVSVPSLFSSRRIVLVRHIESMSVENAKLLGEYAPGSDAVVVALASGALSPALRAALGAIGELTSCPLPTGRGVMMRVEELARLHKLTLDAPVRQLLAAQGAGDMVRLASVCEQLAAVGIHRPTPAQAALLLGTAAPEAVPWELADALEAGDMSTCLHVAARLEPLAALGFLASRLTQVGKLVEHGLVGARPEEVMSALELKHRFQAEKLGRLGRVLGISGVRGSWNVLAAADLAAKAGKGSDRIALELALAKLLPLWSGRVL